MCDKVITDHDERDRIQEALNSLSPQSDKSCKNADRMYLGTSNGLVEGYTDYEAVCRKEDLIALAERYSEVSQIEAVEQLADVKHISGGNTEKKVSGAIPVGARNSTLSQLAGKLLKRYGDEDGKALEAFRQHLSKCEEPLDHDEVNSIWRSGISFYRNFVKCSPEYVSPEDYSAKKAQESLKPNEYTDVDEARIFAIQYGDECRYSEATKWIVYDGKCWKESDLRAQGLMHRLTDRQLEDARKEIAVARAKKDAFIEAGDEEGKQEAEKEERFAESYRGFILDRRKSARISATLTEARPSLEIDVQELDADPFMLNTPDGTVDLRTGVIHPHNPGDYCTKMTAVSPSEDGMDEWMSFLDRITCGDKELQEYHQICSGMELVGKVFSENLIIAYGSGGNGKSTFYNAKYL